MSIDPFASDVADERRRQNERWGRQRHRWAEWMTILGEEYGEACEVAVDLTWHDGPGPGARSGKRRRFRTELIQLAAVCAQMIEQLDEETADLDRQIAETDDDPPWGGDEAPDA